MTTSLQAYIISEGLKRLGKIKLSVPTPERDVLRAHRFKTRGLNRKTLRQVPDRDKPKKTYIPNLMSFIRGLDLSNKVIDTAKKAPSGVWKISQNQVLDIAKKYKFNVPNDDKPMKHLGSTGIQLVRFKPGVYYLYKPRRFKRKNRRRNLFRRGHQSIIKGVTFN